MEQPQRTCTKCEVNKPLDEFELVDPSRGYRRYVCQPCRKVWAKLWRENKLAGRGGTPKPRCSSDAERIERKKNALWRSRIKTKYGLTPEKYDSMLAEQGGQCAICSAAEPGGAKGRFYVDHDHATGQVRALLCHKCNSGIGSFGDDLKLLRLAVQYLERHHGTK